MKGLLDNKWKIKVLYELEQVCCSPREVGVEGRTVPCPVVWVECLTTVEQENIRKWSLYLEIQKLMFWAHASGSPWTLCHVSQDGRSSLRILAYLSVWDVHVHGMHPGNPLQVLHITKRPPPPLPHKKQKQWLGEHSKVCVCSRNVRKSYLPFFYLVR